MTFHSVVLDLNSSGEVITILSLNMVTFDVVGLTLLKFKPLTDSLVAQMPVPRFPPVSELSKCKVMVDPCYVFNLVWSFSKIDFTVVVTGKVESVSSGSWGHEPSFQQMACFISSVAKSLETESKVLSVVIIIQST